jgi:hypothetical protein
VDRLGQLGGPTADLVSKTLGTAVHAANSLGYATGMPDMGAGLNASDVHNARLMIPLQNLQGLRILFDKVGSAVDDSLGFPQRQAGPQNR